MKTAIFIIGCAVIAGVGCTSGSAADGGRGNGNVLSLPDSDTNLDTDTGSEFLDTTPLDTTSEEVEPTPVDTGTDTGPDLSGCNASTGQVLVENLQNEADTDNTIATNGCAVIDPVPPSAEMQGLTVSVSPPQGGQCTECASGSGISADWQSECNGSSGSLTFTGEYYSEDKISGDKVDSTCPIILEFKGSGSEKIVVKFHG